MRRDVRGRRSARWCPRVHRWTRERPGRKLRVGASATWSLSGERRTLRGRLETVADPCRKMGFGVPPVAPAIDDGAHGKFVTAAAYYASPADALSSGSISNCAENGFVR
jgi:hypothetical protein